MNRASVNESHCSLSEQQQIEVFAEKFEREWISGGRGDLSRFVRISPPGLRVPLFRELLLIELVYRRRLGESPTLEEYARQYPHHAAIVADIFEPERHERVEHDLIADRYQIEEPIGKGAFGVVYRATDLELGRSVALKLRRDVDNAARVRSQQWIEEARLAARLDHPAIVAVFDAGTQSDGTSYLVFQFIEGQTLREYTQTDHPLPVVLHLFAEIADGLAYAHQCGCVHRDLKPENILISEDGSPKIVDFGLAIHDDDRPGKAGEIAGSPLYMAPEQVRGEAHRLDGRSDIWALGVMLYETLTGTTPFRTEDRDGLADEILNRHPKPLRQRRPHVPKSLEAVTLKCLSKDPKLRFATAGDVANAIRECGRRPDRRTALIAGLTLVAAVLGGVAWQQWTRRNSRLPARSSAHASSLDLLLWRNDDWISAPTDDVMAVRVGEQARLHATIDAVEYPNGGFPYVLWLDVAGGVAPVYPFQNGSWDEIEEQSEVSLLELPHGESDQVWTVLGDQPGIETIILGIRRSPHPDPSKLQELELPAIVMDVERLPRPWLFRNGQLQRDPRSSDTRTIDPSKSSRLQHPVLTWQRTIHERLQTEFDEVITVVFPLRK